MTADELLTYTEENYTQQNELIARSLMNFYELRLLEEKNEAQEECQKLLFEEVLNLFDIMSSEIEENTGEDHKEIYELLKEIHIKT